MVEDIKAIAHSVFVVIAKTSLPAWACMKISKLLGCGPVPMLHWWPSCCSVHWGGWWWGIWQAQHCQEKGAHGLSEVQAREWYCWAPKGNSLQQHKGRTTMSLPHRNRLRLLPLHKQQMVLADRLTETSLTWIKRFPNRFSYWKHWQNRPEFSCDVCYHDNVYLW